MGFYYIYTRTYFPHLFQVIGGHTKMFLQDMLRNHNTSLDECRIIDHNSVIYCSDVYYLKNTNYSRELSYCIIYLNPSDLGKLTQALDNSNIAIVYDLRSDMDTFKKEYDNHTNFKNDFSERVYQMLLQEEKTKQHKTDNIKLKFNSTNSK